MDNSGPVQYREDSNSIQNISIQTIQHNSLTNQTQCQIPSPEPSSKQTQTQSIQKQNTHVEHVRLHLYGFSGCKIYLHLFVLFLSTKKRYRLTTGIIV